MKAFVDQDTCIGCGLCCGMCDAVFRMNDDGKAEAYQAASEEDRSDVQSAIDSCPVSAIRWED
ncbi:ferredoxin [uncultured Intestinimonas sp.]|uniref:ferredoxin n=1 Tax=uncultured Intestinimonas sp. TaxID=1689265 RepID=UPI0025E4F7FD|nr:ferredoxin [uncultured Intestinimonas sp.]